MKVGEVMTRDVKLMHPDDTVEQAAQRMTSIDSGVLPVGENDRLVGMLTDRDIAIRVVAQAKDPRTTKVCEAMTPEIKYCYEDEDLDHAMRNMAEIKVRRLAVMNRDKRLVGILSLGDIAFQTGGEPSMAQVLEKVSEPGPPHDQAEEAFAGSKPGSQP